MAVATVGAPARRVVEPAEERAVARAAPAEEVPVEIPAPLAPARGIIVALGIGALAWALFAAFLLSR